MSTTIETRSFASVTVGDTLPPLEIPVTASLIASAAIATRDYEPVHHDIACAQERGMPNIFMNILTSQGLMERYVTDWSGPEAVVKRLQIRLGAPNVPGALMTVTGEVSAKDESTNTVSVQVKGQNDNWGMHMQGEVRVKLP